MRAVILYNTSWYVFLLRRNLIKSLQAAGCDITVVAPYDAYTERIKALGVSFIPISMSPRSVSPLDEAGTLVSVFRALKRAQPDVVLSYTAKCNLYAGLLRRTLGFRQIANISGLGEGFQRVGLLPAVMKRLYRSALYTCDVIFFQNRDDREMCIAHMLVDHERSRIIPGSGVDLEAFVPAPKSLPRPLTFLMFGRLLPQKGFRAFMESAQALHDTFGSNVAFWIMGAADHERPESIELLGEIMTAHGQGYVRYLQSTDDVLPILRDADVAVLPSTYNEGIPRSLVEALACGKIIVTTDWKGCRETVQHGRNGFLVPPHDTESLTRALRRIIETPERERARMSLESRRLAESRFNERLVIDAYKSALGLSRVTPLPVTRRASHPPTPAGAASSVRAFPGAAHKRSDMQERRI